ncbi:MAG TPA: glycosyltransferase [Planctomycetota bacterium]|nr:glycosyltransferase [Planctomycetota bacterium]
MSSRPQPPDAGESSGGRDRRPRVSIGMPVLNGARWLPEALDCWLAQDYGDFELVVADNASTDATPAILADYRARDARLRVVRRPQTVPAIENFLGLLADARGCYFAWAACDDLWEPGFLGRLVESLDQRPDVVLAYCQVDRVLADGRRSGGSYYTGAPPGVEASALGRALGILRRARNHSMVYGLMRTDVLAGLSRFRMRNGIASDVALCLELACRGRFHCVPEILFHYRIHAQAAHVQRDDPMYADGRGRRVDEDTVAFVRGLPLSAVEQDLLLRELELWCLKGQRPRPWLLRAKPVRWAYLASRRGIIDLQRRMHRV